VRVALRSTNGSIAFSVQDQGPGIPEADRKLLFHSFRKLSARPTGGEKSTGLGLAIVKKIVDAHGGSIDVASAPGGGARFTVTTPSTAAGS
jgi:signal transduction histidine kinase